MGLLALAVAGCGASQSPQQLRLLREELGFIRDKVDANHKLLLANKERLDQLAGRVKKVAGAVNKPRPCPIKMPPQPRVRAGGDLMSPFATRPRRPKHGRWITRVGPNRYTIKQAGLSSILADRSVSRSARIVPSVRGGVVVGFKLYAIRPGSVLALLGLRNGDTVEAINGSPLTSPGKVLQLYTSLRKARRFSVLVRRRGKPLTLQISIVK